MIKLNRIGNKLGLAGAVGVLLAIGMVANQMIDRICGSRPPMIGLPARRRWPIPRWRRISNFARYSSPPAISGWRELPPMSKRLSPTCSGYKAAMAKDIEAALETAKMAATQDRLQKTKALMEGFTAAVEDLAKAQITLLAQIDKRSVVSDEWTKAVAAQLGSPAMAKLDNRLEIERLLFQADARVNALRAAAWKLGATGDANLVTEMGKTEASLKDVFNKLRGEADDRELLVVVSNLSSIVKRFLAANEEAVKTEQVKNDIIINRTTKPAADAADLMEATVENSQEECADLQGRGDGRNRAQANQISLIMALVVVMSLIASVVFSFLGVARPMTRLNGALGKMAGGDLDVEIPGAGRGDEIGDLAKTVTVIRENAEHKAREEAEAKVEQDQVAAQRRKAEMIKLADDFEGAVGKIVETVSSASTELEASAGTLTATAERAQELTTMVAAASEEASTNVQSVASSTEEMASSITEIGRQVQESARMANEAVDQARTTNDRVSELSKAAARIGAVVELINTIAEQTNLLALNATIEAARAGDAGRGFAVVASEVKALAEQTSKATGEIGQQITGIQAATEESVGAIQAISTTIEKLSEISSTIAAAVEEQGAATQEISRNVQQAARGTQQVSANITDVQRGAGETGTASSQVLSSAQSLSSDSGRLKLEVGKFLNSVRAA